LTDGVGNHAVNADARQQQRDRRKHGEQRRLQPTLGQGTVDDVAERTRVVDRLFGIDRTDSGSDRLRERGGISRGPYDQRFAILRVLLIAPIDLRTAVLIDPFVSQMSGNADDRPPRYRRTGDDRPEPAADRVLAAKHQLRRAFVDDADGRRIITVCFCKRTAADEWNAHRAKVVG